MAPPEIRTNAQRLDDAVELQHLQMQRAASTVRQRVTDPEACNELLECLGLQEVQRSDDQPDRTAEPPHVLDAIATA